MSNHIGEPKRIVVCAANKLKFTGDIVLGVRHYDSHMHKAIAESEAWKYGDPVEQGFIDNYGVFMDRYEALKVATEAGQINRYRTKTQPEDRLFSEDLY